MNDRELHDLWTRKLDGQPLTAVEQNSLQAALSQRADQSPESDQADELFGDWQIDAILRTEIELDIDQFVNRFVERLALSGSETGAAVGDSQPDRQVEPPPVVRPPIIPPPVTPPPRVLRGYGARSAGSRNRRWQSWGYAASAAALLFVLVVAAIVLAIRLAQPDNSNVARDTEQMKGADDETNNVKVKPFTNEEENISEQTGVGESEIADNGQPKNQDSDKGNQFPQDDRKTVLLEIVDADKGKKNSEPKKAPDSNNVSPQVQSRTPIARLTSSEGARWDNGYEPQKNLLPGSLSLIVGTAKITMNDGTVLEISGPIELELAAKDRVTLRSGHLSAHVPKQAVGFTVQTPTSKIMDLGTEFVVDVAKDKSTSVQVTQGIVEVSAVEKIRKADEQTWRLQAGDYKWISGDGRQSFDWRMVVELGDPKKNKEVFIDQIDYDMSRPDQAVAAMVHIKNRLNEAGERLSELPRGEKFSGTILIDGQSNTFDSLRRLAAVRQALLQEMQKRWTGNMMKQIFPDGVLPPGFPRDFFESNGFNFFPN